MNDQGSDERPWWHGRKPVSRSLDELVEPSVISISEIGVFEDDQCMSSALGIDDWIRRENRRRVQDGRHLMSNE